MSKKQRKMLARILISFLMTAAANLFPLNGFAKLLVFLLIYLVIGYDILRSAVRGIFNKRVFDENFLMAIATVGAFALAIHSGSGDYNEAVAVMIFYQTGELFQSYAVRKSRRNISELMDIRPDYANVEINGKLERVHPDTVTVGSIITVQPGEKIPIDGVVSEGESSLDTVALTGESIPRYVKKGDEVTSGCINISGVIRISTTKEFSESAVSKILELTENATSRKSKSEKFISKFARVYTPAVCYAALALAILPPLFLKIAGASPDIESWIYRSLTFLVISCPCALVISIPLTFFAGIGGASREGILIKGSSFIESISKIKYVVFDKTGTLTKGVFEVSEILTNEREKSSVLEYAALAECASSHPISKSLQSAYGKEPDRSRVTNIEEISGHGVLAKVDGVAVVAGNRRLMEKMNIPCPWYDEAGTAVYVALDNEYSGTVVISDKIKEGSEKTVKELKKQGIKKTVMLTGDTKKVALNMATELSVDEVYAGLLPADKVNIVEGLINEKEKGEQLAFVGDGINDAPVLARADVGFAMGGIGSDAAIEAADVVLMDDNPQNVAKAIRLSRKCIKIVRENIIFSLAVKFICLALVSVGMANMWVGIFADVGVMVIAVLNAIRALSNA